MAVAKLRNRVVVFRVTQQEYETLCAVTEKSGARNVSDFVRSTLLAAIGTLSPPPESLTEMSRTLASLKDVVGRVAEKMEQMSPESQRKR